MTKWLESPIAKNFFIFLLLIYSSTLDGQWDLTGSLNIEVGVNRKSKNFISFSAAVGVQRQMFFDEDRYGDRLNNLSRYASTGVQTGFNLYYNGLGDNVLDDYKKARFDFVSSIMAIVGSPAINPLQTERVKVRSLNSFIANPISNNYHHSIVLGSNVVINSDRRNQITGFTNINIARTIHIGYMNDGPPFGGLGLGDRFDRWWTGSAFVEVYFDQGYNQLQLNPFTDGKFEFSFDRFTGNVQQAYEVSNLLGIRYVPDYNLVENYYNRARAKFGYESFSLGYGMSAQVLGQLEVDFQDWIHKLLAMPYHPTYAKRYWILGIQSNQHLKMNLNE